MGAAKPRMVHLSAKLQPRDRRHGPVRGPDRRFQPSLCPCHSQVGPQSVGLDQINVTQNPAAEWIARQLTEAFPWNEAPGYLIRDNDCVYGNVAVRRVRAMGIRDKPIAPASPWQTGFAERLIGSIRHECRRSPRRPGRGTPASDPAKVC